MIWTYADDGRRRPFDPSRLTFTGCVLCGHPDVSLVGLFVPTTDEMRLAVLRIRHRPPATGKTGGLAYGICDDCANDPDVFQKLEASILAASRRTTVQ